MPGIKDSFAKSLLRVSKRHSVADLADHFKSNEEEDAIAKEREDFQALKDIAEYCDMRLAQRIDPNGNEQYIIAQQTEPDLWTAVKYFQTLEEAKQYLVNLKHSRDRDYEQQAQQAEHQTITENDQEETNMMENWNVERNRM